MQRTVARSRLRTIIRTAVPFLLIALLAGCMLPPQPVTETGREVFNLYVIVLVLAGLVFVGVEGFIIYAIVRYRRQPGDETLPEQHHGNTVVEIIWTIIPTVIVFVLFGFSMSTLSDVEARSDDPGVRIQVDGFQWNWSFIYEDGTKVTGAGSEPPVLAVPINEPVRLVLNSVDVNHAFYVPQFLIKRDLIDLGNNGRDNELEFTITEAGTYAGQCAEFCGTSHADMKFVVNAMTAGRLRRVHGRAGQLGRRLRHHRAAAETAPRPSRSRQRTSPSTSASSRFRPTRRSASRSRTRRTSRTTSRSMTAARHSSTARS